MARTSVGQKEAAFKLYAPKAKQVSLAGSFNNWDTGSISAKKDAKGSWIARVSLRPGRYEYKFFVDGKWTEDPKCAQRSYNSFGTQNSVVEVR